MENTGMYKKKAEDTMYHGETNKRSSPRRHGIAGWRFPSFCNGDNPEPAKNPAFVPGIASLTGAAYGIGHASGWLGGVVSGLVGVGAWHVLSSLEGIRNDTRDMTKIVEGIRNDRKDMAKIVEGIRNDTKDMAKNMEGIRSDTEVTTNKVEGIRNKLEGTTNTLSGIEQATKVLLAHLEARGGPEMPGTVSGSSDDDTST